MAGIKDLLSLFYWLDNQKKPFLDSRLGENKKGSHHTDDENLMLGDVRGKKYVQQFKKGRKGKLAFRKSK